MNEELEVLSRIQGAGMDGGIAEHTDGRERGCRHYGRVRGQRDVVREKCELRMMCHD